MKRKFSNRIIAGIATSAVLAAGTLSFTVINAIADEAVSYYGLSADGTVVSGTVTDYTRITSTDTAWGIAGKETWYVADGIVNIITTTYDYDNNKNIYNPVEIKGNVNVILKNGAEVSVVNGIAGTDATITFYSESESANGVIGFIGAYGDDGKNGQTESFESTTPGESGENGLVAVDVASLTVAGGTITIIGGDGGDGGRGGFYTATGVYGVGGDGGNGGAAITDNTKVYLNGGRLNVTAGRGGNPGTNTNVPSEQQDNYKGKPGNNGTSVSGIYAVNGTLNVNKLDDSDAGDTSGDFKLLSVNGYENAKLDIIGHGTAKVTDGTVIETYGDISVAGTLSVDNGTILTNGSITKADSAAHITKTNGGVIRRFTPAYSAGYTLDYAGGKCIAETGYKIKLSHGNTLIDIADANTIVSESNRLNIVRSGDGEIIDDSEPCVNVMPYCIKANNTNETTVTDGNVFAMRGVSSRLVFALNDPDEYRFSGVTVTDFDGNAIPDNMYTFDSTTGEFIALSVDRNLIVTADASLKDVEISVTDSENNPVSTVDIGTDFDNGNQTKAVSLKVKVTEGGSIAKYRVVKESDLNKASGAITDTSLFTVSYSNGNEWGTADDGSSKLAKGATATFTVKPDSNLAAGIYTEDFIVITDRTAYADASAGTQDKALARFTLTYKVEHESDGKLHYSDLTGHYNLCKNCQTKINKENHTFDVKTVNEDTFAFPADCVNPAKYFYSCECGAHTDDTTLVFESGAPNGHTFGEWISIISASCLTSGNEKHICSVCNYEEFREIPMTGHIWESDFTVDKKPTCTEKGSKSIHCSKCDEIKDVTEISETGHSFGEWTVFSFADCTAGGVEQRVCSECGFTDFRNIPPQEHLWEDDFTVDIAPSCTQSGSKSIHCSQCDVVKNVTVIDATGHTFTEWSDNVDATCTGKGQRTRACTVCSYTEYADTDINPDAHLWEDDYTIDKEPTCIEEGSKSIHCSRCDATKDSTVIPLADHIYGEWKTIKEATCTEDGSKKHSCINCGFEEETVITADHVWDTKTTTDKEPTCTEEGSKSIHCTKCDEKKEVQPIPANGHDWSEWETVKASTSSENGLEKRYCFVCGVVEENELDLLPDEPVNPGDHDKWHSDEEQHWHIDEDGNKTDVADHEFRWVVDKEPNGTEPGIGHYECISCDYAKFPREFGGKDSPETGSDSLALWIAVAFVAGGVAPITLKIKSKKSK